MHRLLSLILAVAIGVVSWRVYMTWSATESLVADRVRGRGTQTIDLPPTGRTPAQPRLAMTIVEGDLFHESRRAPTAEAAEATPIPPPNVELIGVIIVGPEPEALVKDSTQGNVVRHVFKGDDVGGYTVSRISPTEVVLTSPGGGEVPLPLALNRTTSPSAGDRKGGTAARPGKEPMGAAQGATAAGPDKAGPGKNASEVRERLRELRRQRREASKARR